MEASTSISKLVKADELISTSELAVSRGWKTKKEEEKMTEKGRRIDLLWAAARASFYIDSSDQ